MLFIAKDMMDIIFSTKPDQKLPKGKRDLMDLPHEILLLIAEKVVDELNIDADRFCWPLRYRTTVQIFGKEKASVESQRTGFPCILQSIDENIKGVCIMRSADPGESDVSICRAVLYDPEHGVYVSLVRFEDHRKQAWSFLTLARVNWFWRSAVWERFDSVLHQKDIAWASRVEEEQKGRLRCLEGFEGPGVSLLDVDVDEATLWAPTWNEILDNMVLCQNPTPSIKDSLGRNFRARMLEKPRCTGSCRKVVWYIDENGDAIEPSEKICAVDESDATGDDPVTKSNGE